MRVERSGREYRERDSSARHKEELVVALKMPDHQVVHAWDRTDQSALAFGKCLSLQQLEP